MAKQTEKEKSEYIKKCVERRNEKLKAWAEKEVFKSIQKVDEKGKAVEEVVHYEKFIDPSILDLDETFNLGKCIVRVKQKARESK